MNAMNGVHDNRWKRRVVSGKDDLGGVSLARMPRWMSGMLPLAGKYRAMVLLALIGNLAYTYAVGSRLIGYCASWIITLFWDGLDGTVRDPQMQQSPKRNIVHHPESRI